MLPSGVLGHNKFGVITKNGMPVAALTGSTNWSPTGLCTQINNLIVIDDPEVARTFKDQWERLKDAGDNTPPSLVTENSQVKSPQIAKGDGKVDVWFTRTHNQVEMDAAIDLIQKAENGIIFHVPARWLAHAQRDRQDAV
jgi:phosphatidylserine/phosphatidylglycerophosphate/cardiolipin synthase-like enzyme